MAILSQDQLWGGNGHPFTRSLFWERHVPGRDTPIMSLGRDNKEGLINLRALYIKYCVDDPTEVDFIDAVFEDFIYWGRLKELDWFQPYLEDWQTEATVRRKKIAYKTMIDEVKNDGKNAFQAAKFLITQPEAPKTRAARRKVKETSELAKGEFAEDITRLEDYMKK